jgi:hypothetical protein
MLPPGFAFEAADRPGTYLNGRVRAVAHILQHEHELACRLLPEFVCDTADQTLPEWYADYGIPDDCNINDLCAKMTAIGDGTCASLQDLARMLLADICCTDLPPEIQPGCWDMGCDQMPPEVEWLHGGSELGFAQLGECPEADLRGSSLGVETHNADEEDCNIAGYYEEDAAAIPLDPPCDDVPCPPYAVTEISGTLLVGCGAPWTHEYTGTAYVLLVGLMETSPIMHLPDWNQMGCMEMGCDQLCAPDLESILCFVDRHRHAHVRVVRQYC